MKIKDEIIKKLESLEPSELMRIYEIITVLGDSHKKPTVKKERPPAYLVVRNALKQCKGSLSEDIILWREDRI